MDDRCPSTLHCYLVTRNWLRGCGAHITEGMVLLLLRNAILHECVNLEVACYFEMGLHNKTIKESIC